MSGIGVLALLTLAVWIAAGCVIGFEQLHALRRQSEWDDHCDDALDLFVPPEFRDADWTLDDDLFLNEHRIETP